MRFAYEHLTNITPLNFFRQKTHSRHHSYPVYVPGNPMYSPPPPPTPPCLVVQQEQANISLSKSQNHIHSYSVVDPPAESNLYYSDPYFPTRNNVYGYAYAPISEGSTHASASVDLGSPGVVETTKRNEGPGWLGWIRGTVSNVGHRVAERAKTSMDSMITTLDPQMKEFIRKYVFAVYLL